MNLMKYDFFKQSEKLKIKKSKWEQSIGKIYPFPDCKMSVGFYSCCILVDV